MYEKKDPRPSGKKLPKANSVESETWYTLAELKDKFNRSKSTINRWRSQHHLICSKTAGTVLVNKDDVEQFLRDHRRIM